MAWLDAGSDSGAAAAVVLLLAVDALATHQTRASEVKSLFAAADGAQGRLGEAGESVPGMP